MTKIHIPCVSSVEMWLVVKEGKNHRLEREREGSEAFGIVCLSKNESEPVSLTSLSDTHSFSLSVYVSLSMYF